MYPLVINSSCFVSFDIGMILTAVLSVDSWDLILVCQFQLLSTYPLVLNSSCFVSFDIVKYVL